jgi:hypothetical protein
MAKPLTGSIKKNDKGDNPKRPDYRGSYTHQDCPQCGAAGGNFWVSSYINTDNETGEKYLSLGMKPKEQQQFVAPPLPPKPVEPEMTDDDIPF